MENKISFTGIKNFSSITLQREGCKPAKNLTMTLNNDINGKDLQEFLNVLKKCSNEDINVADKNLILNLEILDGLDGKRSLSVNNLVLDEKDENLSMFSYLAKLTRRIFNMPEKDMVVDDLYRNNFARYTLIPGKEIENYDELVANGTVQKIFDTNQVKDSAGKINKFIDEIMFKYLGIK